MEKEFTEVIGYLLILMGMLFAIILFGLIKYILRNRKLWN